MFSVIRDNKNVATPSPHPGTFQAAPLVRREHHREVSGVTWSLNRGHQAVISTSWDGTAKQVHTTLVSGVHFQ